jgi:hypothetical protein
LTTATVPSNSDRFKGKTIEMGEERPSFSESSSIDHSGGGTGDDADDFELLQRVEKIE